MRISDWSSDVCSSDLLVQPAVSVVPSAAQAKLRDLTQRRVQLVNMRVAEINRSHQASPALAASHRRVQAALTREITHIERDIQRCLASADASALKARSEEHTSELQSLMRTSYAVFCLKKTKTTKHKTNT